MRPGVAAAWVAGGAVSSFAAGRVAPAFGARANYRGRTVSLAGPTVVAVLAFGGVLARALADGRAARAGVVVAGAALLAGGVGVYDDLRGNAQAKGLAGHLRALRHGRVTSGAVKLAFIGVAGVLAGLLLDGPHPRAPVDAVLVAGCANLLNLFDLRPGRALKVAVLATLPVVATPVGGWVVGAASGLAADDLGERRMLGDGGANALGAALGVALAAAVRSTALACAVASLVVGLTLASEVVSFSRVIDGVAPLRWADRLGRRA